MQRFTSFFIFFFVIPCFNFKVQRERELFVLNCPPHDLKLSEIDCDDRSEEEQHRNNFLQTFCKKNVKNWRFRKSGGSALKKSATRKSRFPPKRRFRFCGNSKICLSVTLVVDEEVFLCVGRAMAATTKTSSRTSVGGGGNHSIAIYISKTAYRMQLGPSPLDSYATRTFPTRLVCLWLCVTHTGQMLSQIQVNFTGIVRAASDWATLLYV